MLFRSEDEDEDGDDDDDEDKDGDEDGDDDGGDDDSDDDSDDDEEDTPPGGGHCNAVVCLQFMTSHTPLNLFHSGYFWTSAHIYLF